MKTDIKDQLIKKQKDYIEFLKKQTLIINPENIPIDDEFKIQINILNVQYIELLWDFAK